MRPQRQQPPEKDSTPRLKPQRTPESWEIQTVNIDLEIPPDPEKPKQRVLLLDDRSDFRRVLEDHLTNCSYQVTSVGSGVEGLREIMKKPFDLIICDMMMPNMGGEMFYWAVARVRPAAGQRFIFFTGHQNRPEIDLFFQKIKATVIFKPFRLGALEMAIRDVLKKLS